MLSNEQITLALKCLPELHIWNRQAFALDQLMAKWSASSDESLIASQVALLDFAYGTNLSMRTGPATSLADYKPRFWTLVEKISKAGPGLTGNLGEILDCKGGLREISEEDAQKLADIHGQFADCDPGSEVSFASKYLHFRFPRLFPIFDSVVMNWIKAKNSNNSIETYKDLLHWCKNSLNEDWTDPIKNKEQRPDGPLGGTEVRLLDSVIWLVGQATKFQQNDNPSREVSLLFSAKKEVVSILAA